MATSLKGSMNYVWDTHKSLGHGATSMVYLGRSKKTFETVAVKVFNAASYNRPVSIQMREFEVMKKLNHTNVVQLLSIEEENNTYCKVIVMEYCPNGSLFSMLEEPANAFGIPENEVILVVKHVAGGMKHLRDNCIVHRDVKPGNILKIKDPDGRSVYKLTDFGAARELEDEEHFVSLYGTEEYLNPHVYERAVLRRCNSKLFDASVDLWSIGVTYYHMATGCLPFRPYGGRKNKELMHEIVSKKDTGVISAVQVVENGPIQWNRSLPDTCQLSSGLKRHLVPLLASLLESNPDKIWPFDKYFETVDTICSKSVVDLFCPNMCRHIKIYIDKEDSITSLNEHVTMETEIQKDEQLLLFDNQPLDITVDSLVTIKNYPEYISHDNPIFVFNKNDKFSEYPDPVYIAPFPKIPDTIHCNYEVDYRTARQCCKIAHAVLYATQVIVHQNSLLHNSVKQYSKELYQGIEKLEENFKYVTQFCQTTKIWFSNFLTMMTLQSSSLNLMVQNNGSSSIQPIIAQIDKIYSDARNNFDTSSAQVDVMVETLNKDIRELSSNNIHTCTKQLTEDWNFHQGCLQSDRCTEFLTELITKLQESTKTLKENRMKRGLNFNDEQIHKYERLEVKKITDSIKIRLTTHCCPRAHELYKSYQQWYRQAILNRERSENIKQNLEILLQSQNSVYHQYHKCIKRYVGILEDNLSSMALELMSPETMSLEIDSDVSVIDDKPISKPSSTDSGPSTASSGPSSTGIGPSRSSSGPSSTGDSLVVRRKMAGDILQGLKVSRDSVEEMVQLVKENNSIIEKFETLSTTDEWG